MNIPLIKKTRARRTRPLEDVVDEYAYRFVRGRWSREAPEDFGLFPIASRDGGFVGYCLITLYRGRRRYLRLFPDRGTPYMESSRPEGVHVGWWYTQSVPSVPPALSWDPAEARVEKKRLAERRKAEEAQLLEGMAEPAKREEHTNGLD